MPFCNTFLFRALRWNQPLTVEVDTDGCAGSKNEIRYLEHVQMILTLEYSRRGDLTIFLTTPMGTKSNLLPTRSEDSSDEGFKKWPFMTTHAWGEDPRGKWTLEIRDAGDARANTGIIRDWQLILYGTKEKPNHQIISHPEVPIHRKAVADDTKSIQGDQHSSVTITKVTYTFGSQPLAKSPQGVPEQLMNNAAALPDLPTIAPLNNLYARTALGKNTNPHIIDNLLAPSVNQVPRFPDKGQKTELHNFVNLAPQNFAAASPYSNTNNPFAYLQARNGLPFPASYQNFNQRSYPSQGTASYYMRQRQNLRPVQRSSNSYKMYKWTEPAAPLRMTPDHRANFWDYFRRTLNRRNLPEYRNILETKKGGGKANQNI